MSRDSHSNDGSDGHNKRARAEDHDGETSTLLAALGSSVQNMDQYEQDVLQTAEFEHTPRLISIPTAPAVDDGQVPAARLGFPSLLALAPSGRAASDVPQMQGLLTKIRSQLVGQPHELSLLLKQQMLLNLIHMSTDDFEQCVRPQEEIRHEQIRKNRFRTQVQKEAASWRRSQQKDGNTAIARVQKAPPPPKSALKWTGKKRPRLGTNGNEVKVKVEVVAVDSDHDEDDAAAGSRLEEIKHHGEPKSVSFATAAVAATISQGHRRRHRVGLQRRKSKLMAESSATAAHQPNDESEEDYKQRRDGLKQLRTEREKRRQRRRQQCLDSKPAAANASKDTTVDDEEEEAEFDEGLGPTVNTSNPTNADNTSTPDASSMTRAAIPTTTIVKVSCPLCQEELEGPDPEILDEVLSKHMNGCQNATTRSTRGQRRTSRRTASRAGTISYAEVDDHEDHGDEDIDHTIKGVESKQSIIRQEADGNNEDDDEVIFVADDEEDDEDLHADTMEDAILDQESTVPKNKLSSVSKRNGLLPPRPVDTTMDDFEEEDYEDRVDDWVDNGVVNMRVMKERDTEEQPPGEEVYDGGLLVPAWINDRLFSYQRTGLQWMWELHRQQAGGIIGDEMGLGKTVQICAFLGSMAASRKLKSTLVIAPATMLSHWMSELKTWAPGLRRILIHQSAETTRDSVISKRSISTALLRNLDHWLKDSRRHRLFEPIDEEDMDTRDPSSFCGTGYVLVTTYENVRRSADIWTQHSWSYVVMDEAQKIRNPDADVTLVCKRLRTPHRLALSGTPIQNDLRELWSLFDFVFPGRLGTLPAFENEFADPIKRGGYSNASPMQVQLAYRCAVVLRDLINPYLLRRLKKDIKEVNRMPGKKEQVLFCRLTDRQRIMYEGFLQSDQVKQVLRGSAQMLGAITTLRKICNHPDLVCPPDKSSFNAFVQKGYVTEADLQKDDSADDTMSLDEEGDSSTDRSGKLEVLAKILPLWKKQGHRVLIFCQWKKMLNIIQRFTEGQGWKFGRLDGNTNVAARQRLVDTFNSDKSYYGMLMTTRTGGVGLNLTGADRIILYDPDWNPQTDAQARERAWRFGQEREVTIYRLIVAGTVEEKIYQRQIFKTALSNRVLQDPRQRRLFSQRDLKDLFSLKVDGGSVRSGAEGITETGQLTNGQGYIDPDEHMDISQTNKDDGETMQSVLKSKGLAGVFDHGVVESNSVIKKASVKDMEEKAKKVAQAAVNALKESVAGHASFTPTWTGSEVTQEDGGGGGRFGENRSGGIPGLFMSRSSVAGVNPSGSGASKSSSNNLLASIRQRHKDIKTDGGDTDTTTASAKQYSELLKRIRIFVKQQAPTTEELLDEFSSVKSYDAAVFRRLLKSVASVDNGRWRLRRR